VYDFCIKINNLLSRTIEGGSTEKY